MSSTEERLIEGKLTGIIIKLFFRVYDRLGFGFLEAVYREALAFEFTREGIAFVREAPVEVWYCGTKLGYYRADFLVEGRVIVELKARRMLIPSDRDQLANYLSASTVEVGLLLHFGPRARFERFVHTNARKPSLHQPNRP
jgi:GxxExxY protein